MFSAPLRRFMDEVPVCVAARAALERLLHSQWLDELFDEHGGQQYEHQLPFSTLAQLMAQVVSGERKSLRSACLAIGDKLAVTCSAVYQKLQGVAAELSSQLLKQSAQKAKEVIDHLHLPPPLLGQMEVRIVDGNHFSATQHRIKETRTTRSGPLPGQALVVMDPRRKLMLDMVPCENAHAQERSLVSQLLERVYPAELWMADRNFCTTLMLFGVARKQAFFLIRQHASTLTYTEQGPFVPCGRIEAGEVFEQMVQATDPKTGQTMQVRRIRLVLDKPTRDGESEIVLVSNVPADKASACELARLYKERWQVEAAFCEMTTSLKCEVRTLGYPKAAIFAFSLALATYNAVSLLKSALAKAHGQEKVEKEISFHYLALELADNGPGMMVAVQPGQWQVFSRMTPQVFAQTLLELLEGMQLSKYKKSHRGPKKPRPKRTSGARNHHVATAKLLANRKRSSGGP